VREISVSNRESNPDYSHPALSLDSTENEVSQPPQKKGQLLSYHKKDFESNRNLMALR